MTITTGSRRAVAAPGTTQDADARPTVAAGAGPRQSWTGPLTVDQVLAGNGLPTAGVVATFAALAGLGAGLDVLIGESVGLGFSVTFLLACILTPMLARLGALGPVIVTAPLVFAGVMAAAAKSSGQVDGSRALALDLATSLALSAPVLFTGTGLAMVVALVRGVTHLARRRGRTSS